MRLSAEDWPSNWPSKKPISVWLVQIAAEVQIVGLLIALYALRPLFSLVVDGLSEPSYRNDPAWSSTGLFLGFASALSCAMLVYSAVLIWALQRRAPFARWLGLVYLIILPASTLWPLVGYLAGTWTIEWTSAAFGALIWAITGCWIYAFAFSRNSKSYFLRRVAAAADLPGRTE